MLEILSPGIQHHYEEKDGARIVIITHQDGSWARAVERDHEVTVHQSGPRHLWPYLDEVREYWIRHGEPTFRGAQATISSEGMITLRRGQWTATIGR